MDTTTALNPFTEQVSALTPLNGEALDGTVRTRTPAGITVMIDALKLHPDPDNIRKDLGDVTDMAASIKQVGILQPLTVAPHPDKAGHYYVKAGHRRLAAAKLAGVRELPCTVRQGAISTTSAIQIMLIENWQRTDLNPMEKAEALGRLRDEEGWRASRIAKALGITDATVSTYLALLELPSGLSAKHARRGPPPRGVPTSARRWPRHGSLTISPASIPWRAKPRRCVTPGSTITGGAWTRLPAGNASRASSGTMSAWS